MTYDYANRMVSHQLGRVALDRTTYAYDALGRRIRKSNRQGTERYYYDGWSVVEVQEAGGATVATHVVERAPNVVLQTQRPGGSWQLLTNDFGTVLAAVDRGGGLQQRYDYSDYGAPTFRDPSGRELTESAIRNPYLFTGHRYDGESRRYYFGARFYDPNAGVFMIRDPLDLWSDPVNVGNATAYVGCNPATRVDEFGLAAGSGLTETLVSDGHWVVGCWDFSETCWLHDLCYSTDGRSREECDAAFGKNMLSSCMPMSSDSCLDRVADALKAVVTPGQTLFCMARCVGYASTYYAAVRAAGSSAYDKAQKNRVSKQDAKKCRLLKLAGLTGIEFIEKQKKRYCPKGLK